MILLSFIFSAICVALACLYIKWYQVKMYWIKQGVPCTSIHPIFGSLTFLQRCNPAIWMRQIYNDFKSPYVGIWLFWRPGLVINSPEIARRVLVKESDVFRNRLLSSGKTDPVGALNLFTINDPNWTILRRHLTSVFTAAKLRQHNHITLVKSRDLIQRLKDETNRKHQINLKAINTDFTTDIIGESAFGISCETVKTGDSVMRRITRQFSAFNLYRGLSWSSIFFFPELVDIFRFSLFPKKSVEELRYIVRSVVELRGGYDKEIKEIKDLLDALLKLKQNAELQNEEMREDIILSQAAIFLLGGFDTTASTMTWIIYLLAWHPEYQEILLKEILAAKQELGDKDFDSTTLANITYLTCIIKETLRLYPPMGWLDRVASKDYKIDDKLTIKAGTVVYVNAVGMQVDPQYYPDPFVFKPDRFLPENEIYIKPYTFMPFGEGPRSCIGTRFAYQTIRQGIASIILNYEVTPLPESPKPIDIKSEKNGLFYLPNDERMKVQFLPRGQL